MRMNRSCLHARFAIPLILVLAAGLLSRSSGAHPLTQGALDVMIHPDGVTVRARVTVEEVMVTNNATSPDAAPSPFAASDSSTYEQHAAYLAAHLHVTADGARLPGGVVKVEAPANPQPAGKDTASYDLIYPILSKPSPRTIDIQDEVLTDGKFAPGVSWQSNYVVRIGQQGSSPAEGLLLTPDKPIHFDCDWSPVSAKAGTAAGAPNRGRIFKDYFVHGIHHIFSIRDPGYDHLLFVTALVLGATSVWELFKLVTAFTLAHTITLTLAALNLVHVSERVVEPLIALSIVFVAVENVVWPSHSHGWTRLGVAFFFGLFHGLGFAGALLEAMQGMNGSVVLFAILAFSFGVETAHQMVVLPLFAILKLARQTRSEPTARQRLSLQVQRFGSIGISLVGLFYLAVALRFSLGM
jgi:hypothetical protein